MKLLVGIGFVSRCHAWKFQVSPVWTATTLLPFGIVFRSTPRVNCPEGPELRTCPGPTNRPTVPPRAEDSLAAPPYRDHVLGAAREEDPELTRR